MYFKLWQILMRPLLRPRNFMETTAVKTSLKKMNLRPFKLFRVYLEPLNSSNVGDFSWS